jgi:hypothetical protein
VLPRTDGLLKFLTGISGGVMQYSVKIRLDIHKKLRNTKAKHNIWVELLEFDSICSVYASGVYFYYQHGQLAVIRPIFEPKLQA